MVLGVDGEMDSTGARMGGSARMGWCEGRRCDVGRRVGSCCDGVRRVRGVRESNQVRGKGRRKGESRRRRERRRGVVVVVVVAVIGALVAMDAAGIRLDDGTEPRLWVPSEGNE